jgi:hypothetical protein
VLTAALQSGRENRVVSVNYAEGAS